MTAFVVLAAGQGTRMGGPKALAIVPKVQLPWALAHAEAYASRPDFRVIVVVREEVARLLSPWVQGCMELVISHAPESLGMTGSIDVAARFLADITHVLLTPVDAGIANVACVDALRFALREKTLAARPRYKGRHGHPVAMRKETLQLFLDSRAGSLREFLRQLGERCVSVDVENDSVLQDCNTPEEFEHIFGSLPKFVSTPISLAGEK